MAKAYYTLLTKCGTDPWTIEFGDYSRAVVVSERDEYREQDYQYHGHKFRIIKTGDTQFEIENAVRALNNTSA